MQTDTFLTHNTVFLKAALWLSPRDAQRDSTLQEKAAIPWIYKQGFTPPLVLAHLGVESLPLAHETEVGAHPVNAAVLERPLHTAFPNLG
jgi:hypothetical protein